MLNPTHSPHLFAAANPSLSHVGVTVVTLLASTLIPAESRHQSPRHVLRLPASPATEAVTMMTARTSAVRADDTACVSDSGNGA